MLLYNKNLKNCSRDLRQNMTDAERRLWSAIRMKQLNGYRFYRQKVIRNFIVDFYCHEAHIVLEVDGGQHYTEEGQEKDKRRDRHLNNLGIKVLRFSDTDVLTNISGVVENILENMENKG
jgi:very-short-patch-repair endonuclease